MLKALFTLLLVLGGMLAALGVQVHQDDHAAADWIAVPATVVDLQVRSPALPTARAESPGGVGPAHIPVVVFEWQVDGQRYRSTRFRLGSALADAVSRDAARAMLAEYPVGSTLTAWRHPQSPERAVLDRGGSARGAWLVVLGALMMGVGAAGLYRVEHVGTALRRRRPPPP
jgi:hypothetical protein